MTRLLGRTATDRLAERKVATYGGVAASIHARKVAAVALQVGTAIAASVRRVAEAQTKVPDGTISDPSIVRLVDANVEAINAACSKAVGH